MCPKCGRCPQPILSPQPGSTTNAKQKMGTALGAYNGCQSPVRPDAPGLSPFFLRPLRTHQKKLGTVPSPSLYCKKWISYEIKRSLFPRQYLKLRQEQSPFFHQHLITAKVPERRFLKHIAGKSGHTQESTDWFSDNSWRAYDAPVFFSP